MGVSSLLAGEGSASHPVTQWQMLTGMLLIIASQVRSRMPFTMCHSSQCCCMTCRGHLAV